MESSIRKSTRKFPRWLVITTVILIFLVFALAGYRLVTGRSLGLRSFITNQFRTLLSPIRAVQNRDKVLAYSKGDYTNLIFLHHSVGRNLIDQGKLRELFAKAGYSFWDQDYNPIGLRDPNGRYQGYAYAVPFDNTDPDGLAGVFNQNEYDRPYNALSGLLQHEVIIFKSCFPASQIKTDQQLEKDKNYYLQIRSTIDRHPEKIFNLLTQPPMNPARSNSDEALRARALSQWLMSGEFVGGRTNLFVFDLFDKLAESNPSAADFDMLRSDYREGRDNHPNQEANETIAPQLVDFVNSAIVKFRSESAFSEGNHNGIR